MITPTQIVLTVIVAAAIYTALEIAYNEYKRDKKSHQASSGNLKQV